MSKKLERVVAQRLAKAKKPAKKPKAKLAKAVKVTVHKSKGQTAEVVLALVEPPPSPVAATEAVATFQEGQRELPYYRAHFDDEVAQLGSGMRSVLVVSAGPKWIKLLDPSSCLTDQLPTPDFERNQRKQLIRYDRKDMIQRLLRIAKEYDRYSAPVRDAVLALGAKKSELPDHKFELHYEGDATAPGAPKEKKVKVPAAPPVELTAEQLASEKPLDKEGSGRFIMRLWMLGKYDPDQLVALVLANYPGRTTKRSDVYYNYKKLVEAGTPNCPPWPPK